jgi:hypothetical protein
VPELRQSFVTMYPRIAAMLRDQDSSLHAINERTRYHLARHPLWRENKTTEVALYTGTVMLLNDVPPSRHTRRLRSREKDLLDLVTETGGGYGIGRIALGTDLEPCTVPAGFDAAGTIAAINTTTGLLDYDDVVHCTRSPDDLSEALTGFAEKLFRGPMKEIMVRAKRLGFLTAVAEEVVVRGR